MSQEHAARRKSEDEIGAVPGDLPYVAALRGCSDVNGSKVCVLWAQHHAIVDLG